MYISTVHRTLHETYSKPNSRIVLLELENYRLGLFQEQRKAVGRPSVNFRNYLVRKNR